MPLRKIGEDLSMFNYQEDVLYQNILRQRIHDSVYNPDCKKRDLSIGGGHRTYLMWFL